MKNCFWALLSAVILVGCSQDGIVDKQKDAANDLSGSYTATENGAKATLKMNLIIKNEQGNFDLNMTMRRDKINATEIAFYNSAGIPASYAEDLIKLTAFGVGTESWKEIPRSLQADSISTDKGKTTQFLVCSGLHNWNNKFWTRFCLSGTSKKASRVITGKFQTFISSSLNNAENFVYFKALDQAFTSYYEESVILE